MYIEPKSALLQGTVQEFDTRINKHYEKSH